MCRQLVSAAATLTLTIAVALVPAFADADPILPGAVYGASFSQLGGGSATYSAPGTYVLEGMSTTIAAAPLPSLTGDALGFGNFGGDGSFESFIVYYFSVVGPGAAGLVVPLLATVTLETSAVATGPDPRVDASARFSLNAGESHSSPTLHNIFVSSSGVIGAGTHDPGFSGTVAFQHVEDQVGRIQLQIDLRALAPGRAHAFADPYVFIDPDWLSTHPGYSVIVSEGIGNAVLPSSAVPEPTTLTLVGLGVGGFVARRVRRRRSIR